MTYWHVIGAVAARNASPIRISVLDSSFNPPTLAHLALIRSRPPPSRPASESSGTTSPEARLAGEPPAEDYDARLLLLSVRNADKSMKPGDANYTQRLEMMIRLAHALQYQSESPAAASNLNPPHAANIAVAIIDEPTFINKSSVLRSFLLDHLSALVKSEAENDGLPLRVINSGTQRIQLTFLMGFDTLERFLAPRYYVSSSATHSASDEDAQSIMLAMLNKFFAAAPTGDDSCVVCAHRSSSSWLHANTTSKAELATTGGLAPGRDNGLEKTMAVAQKFLLNSSLSFINISESDAALSSSEVRARISRGSDWKNMVVYQIANFIEEQALYFAASPTDF